MLAGPSYIVVPGSGQRYQQFQHHQCISWPWCRSSVQLRIILRLFATCFSLFSHRSSLVDITDMSEDDVDELRRRMVTVEWIVTEHFIFLFWDSGL